MNNSKVYHIAHDGEDWYVVARNVAEAVKKWMESDDFASEPESVTRLGYVIV